jgi:SAM-dependent methyltransferase
MKNLSEGVQLEDKPCPNGCAQDDRFVLEGEDLLCGVAGVFRVVRCNHCGLERTNPRPTPDSIGVYYPVTYAPYNVESDLHVAEKSGFRAWLRQFLGLYARMLPPQQPGRMLEIGCSTGRYMEFARAKGWQVDGIEYSREAAEAARAKGFTVTNQPLETIELPDATYDMVVAWMVLEHLHDPALALDKLARWMKPGGRLVASVPETASLARWFFGRYCYDLSLPTHLYHFSHRTLRLTLANAGWNVERVIWQRNCQTLLKSAMYWAHAKGFPRLYRLVRWTSESPGAGKLRALLNVLCGITRTSGRIEFWATRIEEN